MTTTSDLLNSPVPSPTALVAVINGIGSTTYTPTKNVELLFTGRMSGSDTFNGSAIFVAAPGNGATPCVSVYVGAGQTVTYVSSTGANVAISARSIQ